MKFILFYQTLIPDILTVICGIILLTPIFFHIRVSLFANG